MYSRAFFAVVKSKFEPAMSLNSKIFKKLLIIFYPLQKLFSKMNDKFFITIINYVALSFGIIAFFMSI